MRTITWMIVNGLLLCFMAQPPCFAQERIFADDMEMSDEALEEFYARYQDELAFLADQMDAEDDEVEEIEEDLEEDVSDEGEKEAVVEEKEEDEKEQPAQEVEEKKEEPQAEKPEEQKEEEEVVEEDVQEEEVKEEEKPAEEKKDEKPEEEPKEEEAAKEEEKPASEPTPTPAPTPAPAPKSEEKVDPEEIGIDTIDLNDPAGNWLYKRIWWNRAQERYEQIKGVFDSILEMRMPFFKRRAEIDRKVLEPFYVSVGLEKSELVEVLAQIQTLLDQERKKEGALNERERALLTKIEEDKTMLDQMHKDVTALAKFDDALDDALNKLTEQVNAARNYEKQAWQAYKDIGKELNDKRAHDLYYGMDTPYKNITNIAEYVRGVFKQHFTQVDTTIEEHAKRIQEAMKVLKEKGIDLKEQFDKLQQPAPEKPEQKESEEEQGEVEEEGGILGFFASIWQSLKDAVFGVYDWIFSFFGTTPSEEVVELDVGEEPVEGEGPQEPESPEQTASTE